MAFAALEMAVADAHLRAEGCSFASLLGVEGRKVEAGAVVGAFTDDDAELVDAVRTRGRCRVPRVKVKIAPGWDVEPLEAITTAFPSLRLQVDANGSYTEQDADHLKELDGFGLLCLEQPFAASRLEAHSRLAAQLTTPICLDESLDSPADVAEALAVGACSVVEVKPGRLGGIGAALEVVESCAAGNVSLWMGGMFESGFARGVNATVGRHFPGSAWPGDLSPAGTYLAADVVAPSHVGTPSTLPDVALPAGSRHGSATRPRRARALSAPTRGAPGLRALTPPDASPKPGRIGPGREQSRPATTGIETLATAVLRRIALPCNARSSSGA